jgi:hypothetical protein
VTTFEKLVVRPPRRTGELALGHWLRVAHLNGLTRPAWLIEPTSRVPLELVRICPKCLSQSQPGWLEGWADRHRPLCEEHETWLVDECPGCSRQLRWSTVRFLSCCCGHDLRDIPSVLLTPDLHQTLITDRVPLSVLSWLGAMQRFGLAGKPLKKASRQMMREVIALAQTGAEMVRDWPSGFFRALDGCQEHPAGKTGSLVLINEAMPGLTKRIAKLKDSGWRSLISKALGEYAVASRKRSDPADLDKSALIGRNDPGGRLPSVAGMAKVLGVRPQRLAFALDCLPQTEGALRRTGGGRVRRLVTQTAALQARRLMDDEITKKQAARLIGLSAPRIDELIRTGRLQAPRGRLRRSEVMALRQSLVKLAIPAIPTKDAMRLDHAMRYWVPLDRTAQFLDDVRQGRLVLYGATDWTPGAKRWMSRSQVQVWASREQAPVRLWLTVPECADRLALKQQVIYHLVRVGLIRAEKAWAGRRRAQVVTLDALRDFEEGYEALSCAAVRAGVDHRIGLDWALAAGLSVVSGPRVDGGRQYFVRQVQVQQPEHLADKSCPPPLGDCLCRRPD